MCCSMQIPTTEESTKPFPYPLPLDPNTKTLASIPLALFYPGVLVLAAAAGVMGSTVGKGFPGEGQHTRLQLLFVTKSSWLNPAKGVCACCACMTVVRALPQQYQQQCMFQVLRGLYKACAAIAANDRTAAVAWAVFSSTAAGMAACSGRAAVSRVVRGSWISLLQESAAEQDSSTGTLHACSCCMHLAAA
jgi:hypothetical protein